MIRFEECGQDTYRIEGIIYTGEFFRDLASVMPVGSVFRIVARSSDGVLSLERLAITVAELYVRSNRVGPP